MSRTSRRAERAEDARRACVVCRSARRPDQLLRVGEAGGQVVVGRPERGRSAYVCVARACLDRLDSAVLGRGLRTRVTVDRDRWLADLHRLAERRVLDMVGLARRQGGLVCGVEDAARGSGLVLVASDLAERNRRRLGEHARTFVNGSELGRAAGTGWLGAARVGVKRLSEQAVYWLSLWYESRSVAVASAAGLPESSTPDRQLEVADG